jgi:hypothetical protein
MTSDEKRNIYMQGLDAQEFIDYIWTECKGVESFLIGSSVELAFKSVCKSNGWNPSKIGDLDTSKRYDFECVKDSKTHTFEIKTLSANKTVSVGYKDSRRVLLPSGYEWSTKARHISERFDYFVVSLVNYTNNNLDLVAIPFENLPKLKVKNKKDHIFTPEERVWIAENYISASISLKGLNPLDKRFIKLGSLLNNL